MDGRWIFWGLSGWGNNGRLSASWTFERTGGTAFMRDFGLFLSPGLMQFSRGSYGGRLGSLLNNGIIDQAQTGGNKVRIFFRIGSKKGHKDWNHARKVK